MSSQRPIQSIVREAKVADLLSLWRNRPASVNLLIGITVIWFLFEVVDYNFVTLLCHIIITAMLVVFIWYTGADIFKWTPPTIPKFIIDESAFKEVALVFHTRLSKLLSDYYNIATGKDFPRFFLAIISLWILSVIGTYFSFLNLLFVGVLCLETLPFLYRRYKDDVDDLSYNLNQWMKKMYREFESNVLSKIPRGPVKEKKVR